MSRPSGPSVEIRLLGPVEVLVDGAPLAVDTRKAVALLAYLAVTARPADRDALAALLWPEADDTDARGAFRRTLSVLNAGLGGVGLRIDRRAVVLDPSAVEVDVLRFGSALARARAHRHGPNEACRTCLASLDEAAALDRGEFMAGFSLRDSEEWDAWQLAEAEAYRRDLAGALERLARMRAGAGDHAAAIDVARRWVDLDPLHEPAQRLLIGALAGAGEIGAAIGQYRDAVAMLDRELGVAPLAETTALYEAIRDGTFVAPVANGAVATGAATPGGLGAGADGTPPGATRDRPSAPSWPPFVGRGGELAALLAAHRAAATGGRLAILEGSPGIGKTRMASELIDAVRAAGGVVLSATCYRGEAGIALEGIADLLRDGLARPDATERLAGIPEAARMEAARLVPALLPTGWLPPAAAADPGARARLLDALATVLTALVAGRVPGLIAVDDLQWADTSTLELLGYLARRPAGRSLLILLAVRREDLDEPARVALGSLERVRDAEVVRLAGLGAPAVAELVAAAGSALDPAALALESEGLPLFVVEALAEPRPAGVPPSGVRALLEERIERVGEVAAQVLAAAAILGRGTDVATLRGTGGRTEDEMVAALEELMARGIIREIAVPDGSEPVYDVSHGAMRDAILERTSLARRRLLHRRAADTLRLAPARGLDLARLARIATHERAAGRDREAALAHLDAGALARSLYANREAITHFEAALALGHEDASMIHEALGELRTRTGDYAGAVASLERAAATAAEPARLAAIEGRLALAHQRFGDHAAAASHLLAALAPLGPDDPARTRIAAEQAVVALGAGDLDAARERASSVLTHGGDDPVAAAHAHRVIGLLAIAESRRVDAEASLMASLALARRADDPGLVIAAHNALALVAAAARDTPAAIDHGVAALAEARRTGDLHLEAAVEGNLADVLHAAGRDDESREHQLRSVALFAEVGGSPGELQPEIWKLSAW